MKSLKNILGGEDGSIVLDIPMFIAYLAGPAYSGYDGFMCAMYNKAPDVSREAMAVGGNAALHLAANKFHKPTTSIFGAGCLNAGAFAMGYGAGWALKHSSDIKFPLG